MNYQEARIFYQEKLRKLEIKHYNFCNSCQDEKESSFLLANFALNLELSIVPVSSQDPNVILAKYKWWQEELYKEKSANKNHPLLIIFRTLIPQYKYLKESADIILKARERDYSLSKYQNFTEIEDYLNKIHFSIIENYLKEFSYVATPQEINQIKHLTYALKAKNICRSLKVRDYNNHPFIPAILLKELHKFPSFERHRQAQKLIFNYGKTHWQKAASLKKSALLSKSSFIKKLYNEAKKDFSFISNIPFL